MRELLDELCPKCGDQLVIREHSGTGHSFIGCLSYPGCYYTRKIKEGEELKLWQPPPLYCEKCHHTGLLPFILPDGIKSKYAQVFCECREKEARHEHQYPIKPSDFDFAMSYDFRSFIEREVTGGPLPALYPPRIEPQEVSDKPETEWSKDQWRSVQQTRGMVLHLNNQVKELMAKKKDADYS